MHPANKGANRELPHPTRRTRHVAITSASYALLRRLAELQSIPITTAVHRATRAELSRLIGDGPITPEPFVVASTYVESDRCVRLQHPLFDTVTLRQREAKQLATTLDTAGRAVLGASCGFKTARCGTELRISQGGRFVALFVGDRHIPLTRPVAIDLAEAIEAARTASDERPANYV